MGGLGLGIASAWAWMWPHGFADVIAGVVGSLGLLALGASSIWNTPRRVKFTESGIEGGPVGILRWEEVLSYRWKSPFVLELFVSAGGGSYGAKRRTTSGYEKAFTVTVGLRIARKHHYVVDAILADRSGRSLTHLTN